MIETVVVVVVGAVAGDYWKEVFRGLHHYLHHRPIDRPTGET